MLLPKLAKPRQLFVTFCTVVFGTVWQVLPSCVDAVRRNEVCQTETFQAECQQDEVIIMTSARYGRMTQGRCVQINMGYLGCYSDVLSVLDGLCSGRQRCSVSVPNPLLDVSKPCLELITYLDASYTCLKGTCLELITYMYLDASYTGL